MFKVNYTGLFELSARAPAPLVRMRGSELIFNTHPDPAVMRARITDFEKRLNALSDAEKVEFDTENTFVDGMLVRKMFAEKDKVIVGKVHRKACVNFVESGDMSIITESGFARVRAGFNVISPAGLQKVGIAHEDTIFINVFRVDATNIEDALKEVACDTHEELHALAIEGEKS